MLSKLYTTAPPPPVPSRPILKGFPSQSKSDLDSAPPPPHSHTHTPLLVPFFQPTGSAF